MGLWYRVFGRSDVAVKPDELLAYLNAQGTPVTGRFAGEDGWLSAEIVFADKVPLYLERFPSTEEGIRAELNNWAAYLETCDDNPIHVPLMEQVIQTLQLFTLCRPMDSAGEVLVERLCVAACHYLARATDGVYQVDDQGFFAADGTLLLREC
jgi:hypothetical protein